MTKRASADRRIVLFNEGHDRRPLPVIARSTCDDRVPPKLEERRRKQSSLLALPPDRFACARNDVESRVRNGLRWSSPGIAERGFRLTALSGISKAIPAVMGGCAGG